MPDTSPVGSSVPSANVRKVLLWVVALILAVFIISSLYVDTRAWPFPGFTRSDGTLVGAIRNDQQIRLVTLFIGLAARDAAGGKTTELTAPKNLNRLARVSTTKISLAPYSAYFLEQMTGSGLNPQDYDPVISEAVIGRLLAENRVVRYPMNVVAVVGREPNGRVSLFTDSGRTTVYAVSSPLLADKVRP